MASVWRASVEPLLYQLRGTAIYSQGTRDSSAGLSVRTTFYSIDRAPGATRQVLFSPELVNDYVRSPLGVDEQVGSTIAFIGHIVFSANINQLSAGRLLGAPLPSRAGVDRAARSCATTGGAGAMTRTPRSLLT